MGISDEFIAFKNNYNIGSVTISDISARYKRITARLNRDFWNTSSETAHSFYVGSYGRDTAARGLSDLDVAFVLPVDVYSQYNNHIGNGQSALLQAVRNSIRQTYPSTEVGGDGQVVVVSFTDGMRFEILPVFRNTDNTWTYPDSNNGGRWRVCNPLAEIAAIDQRNKETNRNLKHLCRMMRVWRDHNEAGISGALIDTLAYQFIGQWGYRDKSFSYHDYMARDFLGFLAAQDKSQQFWRMPGSNSEVAKSGAFVDKAAIDFRIASDACVFQTDENAQLRRNKWRSVFGSAFPI